MFLISLLNHFSLIERNFLNFLLFLNFSSSKMFLPDQLLTAISGFCHFSLLFVTFRYFSLLFVTFRYFSLLFVTFRYFSLLFVTFRYFSLLFVTFRYFLLLRPKVFLKQFTSEARSLQF